jgi:ankyrin repeat protein
MKSSLNHTFVNFMLKETGMNPNSKNGLTGMTALHYAVIENKPEMINVLIDAGADLNIGTHREESIKMADRLIDLEKSKSIQQ